MGGAHRRDPPARADASSALLEDLFAHRYRPEHTCAHCWAPGDLVVCEVRGVDAVAGSDRRHRSRDAMCARFADGKVVRWTEYSDPNVYHRAVDG